MALTPGTVDDFTGSLAEAIEDAFAGELMAQKQKPLPEVGRDELRILFAAVAQGVVTYLRRHQSDFHVQLSGVGTSASATMRVQASALSLTATGSGTSRTASASGEGFLAGSSVTLVWESTGATGASTSVRSDGTFGPVTLARPAGVALGRQLVGARDNVGNAVVRPVNL